MAKARTAKQRAALRKAQLASARKRRTGGSKKKPTLKSRRRRIARAALGWIDNKNYMQKVEAYKNAEHMEPVFIGRGHPLYDGKDHVKNPRYKEVMQDHG